MLDRSHPLGRLLADAADGRFPPPDLGVEVAGPPVGRSDAVVAFSAHNVVAAPVDPAEVLALLDPNDPGAAMGAPFLSWLADRLRTRVGSLDVVMVADALAASDLPLSPLDDAKAHARVERALRYRDDVRVFGDRERQGVVILGRGLAGRLEVAIEVDADARGTGLGTALARAARSLAGDEPLFAQVAPGNVASVRAFLAAGYRPICAEVLFLRGG
ncbi:MAG TPA: GNAT family N-acetyltransferase [Candidatus Limnocylindria bacterium]|nr:GNAT family N-acetyltransferase [Candidatus Limnocylindria bacterium]